MIISKAILPPSRLYCSLCRAWFWALHHEPSICEFVNRDLIALSKSQNGREEKLRQLQLEVHRDRKQLSHLCLWCAGGQSFFSTLNSLRVLEWANSFSEKATVL